MSTGPAPRGALAAMAAGAMIIGTNGLMVRIAGIPPTVSAFWRMLMAGILLAAFAALVRGWRPLPPRAWAWIAVPALAFGADLWAWHRSILLIGPGLSTLLANVQVFFMALAGVVLFGERLGPRFLGGLLLAFGGLWLMLGSGWATLSPGCRWGVWLGLATGLSYAVYNLGLRRAQAEADVEPGLRPPYEQVLALASLGAAAVLAVAVAGEGLSFAIPSWRSFWILFVLAAFGHCLSWVLISIAMARLRVAVIGLVLLLQPIVAFVLDVWLFGRATSGLEWLGLALTLAGIFLAGLKGRERLPDQPT